jgi:hypothetical protein
MVPSLPLDLEAELLGAAPASAGMDGLTLAKGPNVRIVGLERLSIWAEPIAAVDECYDLIAPVNQLFYV